MTSFYNIVEEYESKFYKMPKWLFEIEPYKSKLKGKNDSRIAYMLLLDRLGYSRQNNWIDDDGNLYFVYTNEELANIIGCSQRQISRIKKDLIDLELLIVKKQGFKFTRDANGKIIKKENLASHLYLARPELDASRVYKVMNIKKSSSGSANLSSPVHVSDSKAFSGSANLSSPVKPASDQRLSGSANLSSYLDIDYIDTNKIHEDTQLDFSPNNYSQTEVDKQNSDLVKNAAIFMTEADNSENYILSADSTRLLTMWCKTPEQLHRVIRIILNARNSVLKKYLDSGNYDKQQIRAILALSGQERIEFTKDDTYIRQLIADAREQQKGIENTLRKIFNSIRTHYDSGDKIRNSENYMYKAFVQYFTNLVETKTSKIRNQ